MLSLPALREAQAGRSRIHRLHGGAQRPCCPHPLLLPHSGCQGSEKAGPGPGFRDPLSGLGGTGHGHRPNRAWGVRVQVLWVGVSPPIAVCRASCLLWAWAAWLGGWLLLSASFRSCRKPLFYQQGLSGYGLTLRPLQEGSTGAVHGAGSRPPDLRGCRAQGAAWES